MEQSEAGRWDFLFWVMGASCLQLKFGGFISEPGPVRSRHLLGCQSQSLSRAVSPSALDYVSFMPFLSGHPGLGGFFWFTSCFAPPNGTETQWHHLIPFHESSFRLIIVTPVHTNLEQRSRLPRAWRGAAKRPGSLLGNGRTSRREKEWTQAGKLWAVPGRWGHPENGGAEGCCCRPSCVCAAPRSRGMLALPARDAGEATRSHRGDPPASRPSAGCSSNAEK